MACEVDGESDARALADMARRLVRSNTPDVALVLAIIADTHHALLARSIAGRPAMYPGRPGHEPTSGRLQCLSKLRIGRAHVGEIHLIARHSRTAQLGMRRAHIGRRSLGCGPFSLLEQHQQSLDFGPGYVVAVLYSGNSFPAALDSRPRFRCDQYVRVRC